MKIEEKTILAKESDDIVYNSINAFDPVKLVAYQDVENTAKHMYGWDAKYSLHKSIIFKSPYKDIQIEFHGETEEMEIRQTNGDPSIKIIDSMTTKGIIYLLSFRNVIFSKARGKQE